jgi:hypothetical protein
MELADWADSLPAREQTLSTAKNAFQLCLENWGIGKAAQAEKIVMQLPISLSTFEKKNSCKRPTHATV